MKKQIEYILTILVTGVLLVACQKDIDLFVPDPVQPPVFDSNWVSLLSDTMPVSRLQRTISRPLRTDSFSASLSASSTVRTGDSLRIFFRPATLTTGLGQVASGPIRLNSLLLHQRGHFIRTPVPATLGNSGLLRLRAAVLVTMERNNQPVQLVGRTTCVISTPVAGVNPQRLYYGLPQQPASGFSLNPDSTLNQALIGNSGYEIITNQLGWIAMGTALPPGTVTLQPVLPARFTNANTLAFISFNEGITVVPMAADVPNRRFVGPPVPPGSAVTLITLSQIGNQYFTAQQTVTSTTGASTVMPVSLNPQPVTLEQLQQLIDTL